MGRVAKPTARPVTPVSQNQNNKSNVYRRFNVKVYSGVARNLNWDDDLGMVTNQTRPKSLLGLGVRMLGVAILKFS